MFDDLRADQAIERTIFERQRECGGIDQWHSIAAQEAKLAEVEIHADHVVEALHDQTGTASGIEDPVGAARPRDCDAVAAAMPESLHRDHAVKGALVVVCGCERVSHFPEIDRRARYAPSETEQLRVRASRPAWKICERDLDDAKSLRVCLH